MSYPILHKTEQACHTLATSASVAWATSSVGVYTGLNNENKTAPCVICWAESAEEDFPESGIWHVKTHILVKEMAADQTSSIMSTLSDKVFEKFLSGSIETDLANGTTNYGVYFVTTQDTSNNVEEDVLVQSLTLEVVCVLKD